MRRQLRTLMKKKSALGIIGTFYVLLMLPMSQMCFIINSSSQLIHLASSKSTYEWIWDDFSDAPGAIIGDDSVVWGSSLGPYYNYDELTRKLHLLQSNYPDLADLFSIGTSHEGRELWTLRLTNRSITSQKSEFHLVGYHHAREAITILNAMYFVDRLIYEVITGNSSLANLLANMEIYITPALNPDGLEVISRFPWMRKNRAPIDDDGDGLTSDEAEIFDLNGDGYLAMYNDGEYFEGMDGLEDSDSKFGEDPPGGVDLNRNYAYAFIGSGSSGNPSDFTYRGEYNFSEPETRAIRDFVRQHDFNFAVSLHSGERAVIAPWGYTSNPPPDHVELDALVQKLKEKTNFPAWSEIGGYSVNGEWGDWMYGAEGVFAFSLETYINNGAWKTYIIDGSPVDVGIWDYFNPPANLVLTESMPVWNALNYILTEPRETIANKKPSIKVDNPVGRFSGESVTLSWQAEDLDDDTLSYNVYLSENGLIWTQIAKDLHERSLEINISKYLALDKCYLIKISASDGMDSVFDLAEKKLMGQDVVASCIPDRYNESEEDISKRTASRGAALPLIGIFSFLLVEIVIIRKNRRKEALLFSEPPSNAKNCKNSYKGDG